MPIATSCPNCHTKYTLADNQLDKTVLCRSCQRPFLVSEDVPAGATYQRPGSGERPRLRDDDRRDDYDDRDRDRERDRDRDRDRYRDDDDRRRRDRAPSADPHDPRDRPRRRRGSGVPAIVWILIAAGGGVVVITGLVVFFLVFGIGGRVTVAKYNRLQRGMTEAQVIRIMGRPHEVSNNPALGGSGGRGLGWKSGKNKIAVILVNDRLVIKAAEIDGQKMSEVGF